MIKRETIDAIVSACRIEEVVGDFVHLTKRGVNLIGLCPFHDEKTPSFNVSPARGIYKCFGCGEAGNAIRFVMQYEKCTYACPITLMIRMVAGSLFFRLTTT